MANIGGISASAYRTGDRCLTVDPAGRFADGAALVAALQEVQRSSRSRRRRGWAVALVGLAAAVVTVLQASNPKACRNAAEHLVGV